MEDEMAIHKHRACFYETDQMGCVHHSNYIRWFEEARIAHMDEMGFPYSKMEKAGLGSPVLKVEAEYKTMALFDEVCVIDVRFVEYTSTRITYEYTVTDEETGTVRCTGRTYHCFRTHEGKVVSLRKACPELDEIVKQTEDYRLMTAK